MNEADPGRNPVIDRNYLTSENVRARFLLYEFADNPVDFDLLVLNTAIKNSNDDVLDLGAADGNLLVLLETVYSHQGLRIGVEPNISQAPISGLKVDLDRLQLSLSRNLGYVASQDITGFLLDALATENDVPLNLVEGTASNIPIGDSVADVVTAMFMMYHVPENELPKAFGEIKRVLRPEGVFALATSGEDNKHKHRIFEQEIAKFLKITAPKPMNTGFTTEKAERELLKYFRHGVVYKQEDSMIIDDEYKIEAYLKSLCSLRDQFNPVPTKEQFEAALEAKVIPKIIEEVKTKGVFSDSIHRSLFIVSDDVIEMMPNFKKLATKR